MDHPLSAADEQHWPLLSVLFITYKRIDLLEKAISSFVAQIDYPNKEMIVSDDASPIEIQDQIRALPYDLQAILPRVNRGLGANINQGMAACKGDFILMIQDDWMCHGPADAIRNTVRLMQAHPEIGIVHYTMGLEPRADTVRIAGFGPDAYIYPDNPQHRVYPVVYSDQPHVRRREVNDFMGPYFVHKDVLVCERDYEQRWDKQTQYKTAMFPAYWLKLFTTVGLERSIREQGFRYKTDKMLEPVVNQLRRFPGVFNFARNSWRGLQRLFKAKT